MRKNNIDILEGGVEHKSKVRRIISKIYRKYFYNGLEDLIRSLLINKLCPYKYNDDVCISGLIRDFSIWRWSMICGYSFWESLCSCQRYEWIEKLFRKIERYL